MFKLKAFEDSGREDQLPHLQYSENITQFDFTLHNVWTNLSASRFALEVMMIGQDKEGMEMDKTRSIDDEYSPGVFVVSICYSHITRSFVMWLWCR